MPIVRKMNEVTRNWQMSVKGVTICSILAKNAVLSHGSVDHSWTIPKAIIHPNVIKQVQRTIYRLRFLSTGDVAISVIGSIADDEILPLANILSLSFFSDVKDMLKKQAIDNEMTEINIKENGPQSESDTDPQTCVEKKRAMEEPENAPMEPPALMIPK